MSIKTLREWGGWAAVFGGCLWCVKGMAILLAEVQQPLLFEIAPLFFAVGLWGIYVVLNDRYSRLARTGTVVASLGGIAAVVNVLAELLAPEIIPQGESATPLTPSFILAGFGWLVGLLLVGVDVWRTRPFPSPWNQLPLSIVVAFVLLMGLFGAISTVLGSDQLIEIPVVIVGLAWVGLGVVTLRYEPAMR